jgi:hypothetical protein
MFSRKELSQFNERRRDYPWIGNCAVSHDLIEITDNMFNMKWRFFKYTLEGTDYYVVKHIPDNRDAHIDSCTVESFDMAMMELERMLWSRAKSEKPNLSKIPLEYVLTAPSRLNMHRLSTLFLCNILPFKIGYGAN